MIVDTKNMKIDLEHATYEDVETYTSDWKYEYVMQRLTRVYEGFIYGFTFVDNKPAIICMNLLDFSEKVIWVLEENNDLKCVEDTLTDDSQEDKLHFINKNDSYKKQLIKWYENEDSEDYDIMAKVRVIDKSLLVSDNIAFLLEDNERISIKAIHLDRRFYYAIFALSTNETLESNMDKEMLCRAKCAFKRNYKLLYREVKERLEYGKTTEEK